MRESHLAMAACLALALAGTAATAAGSGPEVVVNVTAMKEVVTRDASGRESIRTQEVTGTSPGDTLVYRIAVTNRGSAPAQRPEVVDPIPAGTRLISGSWNPAGDQFSVSTDGGKTFHSFPVLIPVRQPDGTTLPKEADLSSYTHVRWVSAEPLPAGASRTAVFKVTVR